MMKLSAAVFVLAAGAALAEPPPARPAGRGPGMMMRIDPGAIETVDGTVEKIVAQGGRRMQGVHLLLKTSAGTVEVLLGPSWFLDRQQTRLQAGDSVSVRGARTTFAGQPALIAIDVKRGGDTLQLRHDDGTPLWAGGAAR